LDELWGQLPRVTHNLHGLYGLGLAHQPDFVDRAPGKVLRAGELQRIGAALDIDTILLRRGFEARRSSVLSSR
jgi:hypothetical protein